jgi:hypothetical protein
MQNRQLNLVGSTSNWVVHAFVDDRSFWKYKKTKNKQLVGLDSLTKSKTADVAKMSKSFVKMMIKEKLLLN